MEDEEDAPPPYSDEQRRRDEELLRAADVWVGGSNPEDWGEKHLDGFVLNPDGTTTKWAKTIHPDGSSTEILGWVASGEYEVIENPAPDREAEAPD